MSERLRPLAGARRFAPSSSSAPLDIAAQACDAAPLLRRAGLSDCDPYDRQQRMSALDQARLVDYASEAIADTAFGLHLAQGMDPREAGLLFYAASAGKDVREALALCARYSRIVNDSVKVAIVPRADGVTLTIDQVGVPRHL